MAVREVPKGSLSKRVPPDTSDVDPVLYRLLNPRSPQEILESIVTHKLPELVREGYLSEDDAHDLVRYLIAMMVERRVVSCLHSLVPYPKPLGNYGQHSLRHKLTSRLQPTLTTSP